MDVTLVTSTGAGADVRREEGLFDAPRADDVTKPQTCLSVDLSEVIAELADVGLDNTTRAAEALALAAQAQRRLRSHSETREIGHQLPVGHLNIVELSLPVVKAA